MLKLFEVTEFKKKPIAPKCILQSITCAKELKKSNEPKCILQNITCAKYPKNFFTMKIFSSIVFFFLIFEFKYFNSNN